jgi:hypothetical protein
MIQGYILTMHHLEHQLRTVMSRRRARRAIRQLADPQLPEEIRAEINAAKTDRYWRLWRKGMLFFILVSLCADLVSDWARLVEIRDLQDRVTELEGGR